MLTSAWRLRSTETVRILILAAIFAVSLFLNFASLGNKPAAVWDEQTNIRVIAETDRTGSFYPVLNGKIFPEKPPLWYLMSVYLNKITRDPLAAGRLVSASFGLIIILTVSGYLYVSSGPAAALTGWLVLASTAPLYLTDAGGYFSTHTFRSADVDSMFVFFLTLSLLLYASGLTKNRPGLTYLGSVAAGLAVMTKSPLGILPFLIFSGQVIINRNIYPMKKLMIQNLFFLVVTLSPWLTYLLYGHISTFWDIYLKYHNFARITTAIEGHGRPYWYYFSMIVKPNLFPAFLLFLFSAVSVLSDRNRSRVQVFTLIAIIAILSATTLMATKLAWYILPVYPLMGILIGSETKNIIKAVKNGSRLALMLTAYSLIVMTVNTVRNIAAVN